MKIMARFIKKSSRIIVHPVTQREARFRKALTMVHILRKCYENAIIAYGLSTFHATMSYPSSMHI